MCGRIVNRADPGYLREFFDEAAVADILEGSGVLGRYNITPGSYLPGVRVDENGGTIWSLMRWGLIPRWAKPDRIPDRTFNARSETVAEKPSFRDAYAKRRCVVPISGYYEWTGAKGSKQPHYFHRSDEEIIALAGLWETWRYEDNVVESCTILTTQADTLLSQYHHRMPVFLKREDTEEWMFGNPSELKRLFNTVETESLVVHPVSREVNNGRVDCPELIDRIGLADDTE